MEQKNLKDRLSYLTYREACKLIGPEGSHYIRKGGYYDIDIEEQVAFDDELFKLTLNNSIVKIQNNPLHTSSIQISCSSCPSSCEHVGAALSLILEEKMSLGLSAPPPELIPIENLSEKELIQRALEDRREKMEKDKMRLKSFDKKKLWTDYIITSFSSGKSYRIALRGWERGESYCSCPDYKTNTLGTCKHIMYALKRVKKIFPKAQQIIPYQQKDVGVYLKYKDKIELRLLIPENISKTAVEVLKPFIGNPVYNIPDFLNRIKDVKGRGYCINIYPDADEYIKKWLYRQKTDKLVDEIKKAPESHPLRKTLLKKELLPYQLEGIAFAARAGRAILADDMGLGKTIQGIGTAILLSKEIGISKVLVICPASVKSQWRIEIQKFSNESCQIVLGNAEERARQYNNNAFFSICNYEQVLRDILTIEKVQWDFIILDEGQRIKNWEAKTSSVIKSLKSPFALVLSGTPLENRLSDLFSVVQFIDSWRLGPAFYFFNRHRIVNEKGRVLGYRNLAELREKLKYIMLRRTRNMVMKELPPKIINIKRIPPTEEQLNIHNSNRQIISTILNKKYLTEMDILKLQKALLLCRMSADSTFLVDKAPPGYSSKLIEIKELLYQLSLDDESKIILFSEWTTMLDLIEPVAHKLDIGYVRLDGSVPQKKRQEIIRKFNINKEYKLFITTNAGAVGLNLQTANTIINVDLPWNPAVLEQRIARAHRMGQRRSVLVYLLVTEGTIEENMIDTIRTKKALFNAVVDVNSKVDNIAITGSIEELKRRLEIILGEKPDAPQDISQQQNTEQEILKFQKPKEKGTIKGKILDPILYFIKSIFMRRKKPD